MQIILFKRLPLLFVLLYGSPIISSCTLGFQSICDKMVSLYAFSFKTDISVDFIGSSCQNWLLTGVNTRIDIY